MDKPLTNKINALTTYANEVIEENDTNLSDAVYTLADGYGQGGGGYAGIEIKTDSNGYVTDYIFHGLSKIPKYALSYISYSRANSSGVPVISFADKPTSCGGMAFNRANASIDWSGLSELEKVEGEYAMAVSYSTGNNQSAQIVNLPKFRGYVDNTYSALSMFRMVNNNTPYAPLTYILPACEIIPQYAWYNLAGNGINITIGSVGHTVTGCKDRPLGSTTNASGTVTIYTDGSHLDTIKTAVEKGAGSNLTFVYKASEATTYNDTSYVAGDTILTSTP